MPKIALPSFLKSRWFLAFLGAAAFVRFMGITWGLPNTFNADEPHLVNLAVSFGGGSLRPYAFKFPSLWPYLLFFFYGLYFLVWSGFGFLHNVSDFIGLYARDITGFYLIGRWLAAACQLAALAVVWRMEKDARAKGHWPWASLLLAFAPVLVDVAHSCKPDSLMFLFVCAAWHFALRVQKEGDRRAYHACGVFLGLALSSHFMALGSLALLPIAHFLAPKPRRRRHLLEGGALAAAVFLAGSPYVLLDHRNFLFWFWEGMVKSTHTVAPWETGQAGMGWKILSNAVIFPGSGSLAAVAILLGLIRLLVRDRRRALLLIGPFFGHFALLINNTDGGVLRYLSGAFPGLALLAAEGLGALDVPRLTWRRWVLAALALGPGLWRSIELDRQMRLPDTRDISRSWILENVPEGAVILTELPHAAPRLDITKEQAEELWKQTQTSGSPRARLYKGMADAHPGGGYRIYRIKYSEVEAAGYARHIEKTQADWPLCDVSGGLAEARRLGVRYVITSSYGSSLEFAPEKSGFFGELAREGALLQAFHPEPGAVAGPVIRVFKL